MAELLVYETFLHNDKDVSYIMKYKALNYVV